jgi:hypothetical protein
MLQSIKWDLTEENQVNPLEFPYRNVAVQPFRKARMSPRSGLSISNQMNCQYKKLKLFNA